MALTPVGQRQQLPENYKALPTCLLGSIIAPSTSFHLPSPQSMAEDNWSEWLVDNDDMYAPSSTLDDLPKLGGALGIVSAAQENSSKYIYKLDAIDFSLPTLGGPLDDDKAYIDSNGVDVPVSDLHISTETTVLPVGEEYVTHYTLIYLAPSPVCMAYSTPSILVFPSDLVPREDHRGSAQLDPQRLTPDYHPPKCERDSEDDVIPYSPLTTYHDPTPLSTPQAQTSQLLRERLSAVQSSPSSYGDSEEYFDVIEEHEAESDSGSEYDPEEGSGSRSRLASQRKRRNRIHTRKTQRSPSFHSSDTPPLSPSTLSATSSIPSSPASNISPLRPGRLRSKQVTSTNVPFSRKCTICKYEPPRNCKAEMARHMNTHTYEERTRLYGHDWFCCGVPVSRAEDFGIKDTSKARTWENMSGTMGNKLMVGGCGQSFVRRDSYRRHLNGKRCKCVGDARGDWVPGNARHRTRSLSPAE
ncbi:hypothetical protein NM688_g1357 [Phlebia brevispora]|uniref:Uncharacterized protein n=1 Tax=Phlebia brevispora TaxID=194682 RepID=A0ACC1TBQ3_9APHY|nr:hypothetical protein NM688_g1357 [Phlebia brevispora]